MQNEIYFMLSESMS